MTGETAFLLKIVALIVFAYMAGSIPFGLLIGRLKGIDLRQHGSKNIGATNAGRVLGGKYFVIVFLLDMIKGFVPALLAGHFLFRSQPVVSQQWVFLSWLIVSACSIIGHNWPCWLGFKGGKGVSTSLGVVLAIYPYYTFPGLIAFGLWIVLVKVSGYVSVGSIAAAACFLVSYLLLVWTIPSWSFGDQWPLVAFSSVMTLILILRHRGNIQRLRHGTENKFALKS